MENQYRGSSYSDSIQEKQSLVANVGNNVEAMLLLDVINLFLFPPSAVRSNYIAPGIYIINLAKAWEKSLMASRVIVASENPKDIIVQSARPYGQRAELKIEHYTGANVIAGSTFSKAWLLILADPITDHEVINKAAFGSILAIAFCDTDIRMSYASIMAINKEKHNIGRLLWLLARMVPQMRNSIRQGHEWNWMVDLFFNHEQVKTKEYSLDGSSSFEYGNCGYDNQALSNDRHNAYNSDNQWGSEMAPTFTFASLALATLGNRSQEPYVASGSNWADLPEHLLDLILDKLVFFLDCVRFSVVCIPWHRIALDNREKFAKKINRQVPMLLLPKSSENGGDLKNLFNITTYKFVNIELRIPCSTRYAGSSRGWLIFVEEDYTITLVNHISPNLAIKLPPILEDKMDEHPYQIFKAILFADPTIEPHDYEVAVIYGLNSYIAFIRPERHDKRWIYPHHEQTEFHDLMYYKGRLYVVDFMGHTYRLNDTLSFRRALGRSPIRRFDVWKTYLLQSMGVDLLLVFRYLTSVRNFDLGNSRRTRYFKVFKWNPSQLNWVYIDSLGGESLFLGDNMSISVTSTDFRGCTPNSIYCTHDDDQDLDRCGLLDFCVYNLEESNFVTYFVIDEMSLVNMVKQPPIWFVPNFLTVDLFIREDRD